MESTPSPSVFSIIDFPSGADECEEGDTKDCQEMLDYLCSIDTDYGFWQQLTYAYNTDVWFAVLQFMSGVLGFIFFLLVYNTKELHVHPMKLIMYMVLFESMIQLCLISQLYACKLDLYVLFAWTIYFDNLIYQQARALMLQIIFTVTLASFSVYMVLMLQMMLCVDLILMVRYPFDKKEGRVPIYMAVSVIVSLFCATGEVLF